MNAYFVTCTDYVTDGDGKVTEIHCTYDPETKSLPDTVLKHPVIGGTVGF